MKKPKKFSGGGTLTEGDRRAMMAAGLPLNEDTRAADFAAYQARQDAAEKRAAARRRAAAAASPAPAPRPRGTAMGDEAGRAAVTPVPRPKPGSVLGAAAKPSYTPSATRNTDDERSGLMALLFGTGRPKIDIRPIAGAMTPTGLAVPGMGQTAGELYPEARRRGGKVTKMAKGGKARSFRDMDAGAGGGMGRIEKTAIAKAGKKIAMKYKKGGDVALDSDYTANPLNDSGYKELVEKSKTKKMAKGGKVKKMADGGLSLGDRLALARAGIGEGDREAGMAAYRARQAAAERSASMPKNRRYGAGAVDTAPIGKLDATDVINARTRRDTAKMNEGLRARQSEAIDRMRDLAKRSGRTMAKGGKAMSWEGSKADEAQDKKLAKKYGMSMKQWEASDKDAKHDRQKSMKGLKKGGKAAHEKGCKCMMCGGKAGYAKGGKTSTAQDGMKTPLRPKPTAMAKGGKVTFGSMKPLPGTKTKSNPGTVLTGASLKPQGFKGGKAKASGAKPSGMMSPLKQVKMASGGKVRGTGIAQRGTKFIGEV